MEKMHSTVVLTALYLSLAGKFSNNSFSSLPYGCNLDLSCLMGRVNGVNPIGRFWNLLCKLDRGVVDLRPCRLTNENLDANTDGIFVYHGFMA